MPVSAEAHVLETAAPVIEEPQTLPSRDLFELLWLDLARRHGLIDITDVNEEEDND